MSVRPFGLYFLRVSWYRKKPVRACEAKYTKTITSGFFVRRTVVIRKTAGTRPYKTPKIVLVLKSFLPSRKGVKKDVLCIIGEKRPTNSNEIARV